MAKVIINSRGADALLKSTDVREHLRSLGSRVLMRLPSGHRMVDDTTDRAAVRVGSDDHSARRNEADTGYLSSALDAAGGGL